MGYIKTALVILIIITALTMRSGALDITERSFEMIDSRTLKNALGSDARAAMGEREIDAQLDFAESVKTIFSRAWEGAGDYFKKSIAGGFRILAAALICALAAGISEKAQRGIALAGTLAVVSIAAGDMTTLLGLGQVTVGEVCVFGKVLMPILASASAAAGSVAASGITYIAVMFAIEVLITLIADVMAPIVWAYVALSAAGSATGNAGLLNLAKNFKGAVLAALKIILGLFVAYLMAAGVISRATDAMTVKSVKLAMSSAVPVAGGVIADAAEAVVAGAGIVRGVTGVFGLLGVIATVLLPFLRIAFEALVFRVCAIFAGIAGAEGMGDILSGIGDAFTMTLALAGSASALLLLGIFVSAAGVSA